MNKHLSPRGQKRQSIFKAHRARGHQNSNLWLVYSYKLDRDLILNSDLELIWWLTKVETNPRVAQFEIAPDPTQLVCDVDIRGLKLVGLTHTTDGAVELHSIGPSNTVQKSELVSETSTKSVRFARWTEENLKQDATIAVRWLKPLAFCAAIKHLECKQCSIALAAAIRSADKGYVGDLFSTLENFELPIVAGVIVRNAILGHIELDLSKSSFGHDTPWKWGKV